MSTAYSEDVPTPDWMIGPADGRDGSEQTPGGHRRSRRSSWLIAAHSVFGLGFGMVNPPITNTAVSGMPGAQAGVAAAVASTSRQVGQTLGVAVLGAVAGGGV